MRPLAQFEAWFATIALVCAVCGSSRVAYAQPTTSQALTLETRAQTLYQQGRTHFFAGEFEAARQTFQSSLDTVDSPNTRMYLGRALRSLGRNAEAYAMLDRAARDAAARAVAEPRYEPTRDAARAEADALVEGLAWLRVEIPDAPAGLTVRVNGHDVQRAGLDVELPLDPGDVDVDVAAPGRLAVHRELTLHAGQRERTEVILEVAPAASRDPANGASSTPTPPLTVTTASSPALRDAGIATATVGGAALVASLVLRLVAEDQFDTLVTLRAQNQTDTELIAAGERNQLLSYVFLGVGVTAAVTGTAMAISGARTRTRALTVVATPTSVGLGGSF